MTCQINEEESSHKEKIIVGFYHGYKKQLTKNSKQKTATQILVIQGECENKVTLPF